MAILEASRVWGYQDEAPCRGYICRMIQNNVIFFKKMPIQFSPALTRSPSTLPSFFGLSLPTTTKRGNNSSPPCTVAHGTEVSAFGLLVITVFATPAAHVTKTTHGSACPFHFPGTIHYRLPSPVMGRRF